MKILQVCSYLYPALAYGGPAKAVYDLSLELSKKHTVTIYTSDSWDETRRLRTDEKLQSAKRFTVIYFRNIVNSIAYNARLFTSFGMVLRFIRNYKQFDVVHIHDVFIFPQLLIGYLSAIFSIPYVISPHGILDPTRMQKKSLLKKIFWVWSKPVLARASVIVAVSEQEAADLKSLGFKQTQTIFNGVPISSAKPQKNTRNRFDINQDNKILTLLYIGKLHPQKGLLELLEAVRETNKKIRVLIAGPDDGALKKLKSYISKYKLSNIHFLGLVDEADKQILYAVSDIFVYPSYAEGFSISILEGMSASLPVIITEGCNFPQVTEHEAGFVVKLQSLKENIATVLQSKQLTTAKLKKLGKNAQELIASEFSIAGTAQKHTELYEKIT